MTRTRPPFHLAAIASLVLAASAGAQSLPNPESDPQEQPDATIQLPSGAPSDDDARIAIPGPDGVTGSQTADDDVTAEAPALGEAERISSLWPVRIGMAQNGRVRLSGERDSAEFILFAPASGMPDRLILSTVSSAYVLPRDSRLRVLVGDDELGMVTPENISGVDGMALPLPGGVLQPGANRVRIEAVHRHRLYCGAQASYDLWTDIDLSLSGAPYRPETLVTGPTEFLTAVAAARGAGEPIGMRFDDPSLRDEAVTAARSLGGILAGGGLSFDLDIPADPEAPRPVLALTRGDTATATIGGTGASPAMVLRVDPTGLPDMGQTLGTHPVAETPPAMETGRKVALSDLGFETYAVEDHLWSGDVTFTLPDAWLVATNERAELSLRFDNAPGLPEGSRLRVIVNGEPVRMIPLHDEVHQSSDVLPVRFGAELLQAGRNDLSFEVIVPGDPADAPCPDVRFTRVSIDDSSMLRVPNSPEMYAPGVASALGRLGPEGLTEALTRATRAERAGNILDIAAALPRRETPQTAGGSVSLIVTDANEIDQASFGSLWSGREVVNGTLGRVQTSNRDAEPQARARRPVELQRAQMFESGIVDWAGERVARVRDFFSSLLFPDPAAELAEWMGQRRGQALLYQLDEETPDTLYLAVTEEARFQDVADAVGRVATTGVPLQGHMALLTWDGRWESWADTSRLPELADTVTFTNARAIAGNYAAARPSAFVAVLLLTTLLSAAAAYAFLIHSRGRQ
ncbi:cellulose synthase subunit [Tranquillimonas rosea]|uniref:Cyclic di-GMP-binding protein n=1 Tax=Tranquillimonas rosea TaxID=641238 RepID=A0A1H9WKR1_9RHOB|nr:cellulose biosynthesis cyclic di-GMP-binding regulatory protein BcsB [Tranquillimonas rosea]SES34434.1 cellulose synthase subunit [Tranquillimonas rosea]